MRRGHRDDPETGDFPGERVFRSNTKYVLQDASDQADALVVAFSAAHPPDTPPRYYTHKALRELPCPRLFVLDDQCIQEPLPRPCWYLGRKRAFDVADSVLLLMEATAEEFGVPWQRVIPC